MPQNESLTPLEGKNFPSVGDEVRPSPLYYHRPACKVIEVGVAPLMGRDTRFFVAEYPWGARVLQWETDAGERDVRFVASKRVPPEDLGSDNPSGVRSGGGGMTAPICESCGQPILGPLVRMTYLDGRGRRRGPDDHFHVPGGREAKKHECAGPAARSTSAFRGD